jgi:hypothetical protein
MAADETWAMRVFLARASARFELVEAGVMDAHEALEGLLPALSMLIEDRRDCQCAREIGAAWEAQQRARGRSRTVWR